jgi:hypothetical protein
VRHHHATRRRAASIRHTPPRTKRPRRIAAFVTTIFAVVLTDIAFVRVPDPNASGNGNLTTAIKATVVTLRTAPLRSNKAGPACAVYQRLTTHPMHGTRPALARVRSLNGIRVKHWRRHSRKSLRLASTSRVPF